MGWFDWLKIRPKGPKFEERHDIGGVPADTTSIRETPSDYICYIGVEEFAGNVLARTYSKNGKLYLSMDEDTESPNNFPDVTRLFTWIHELCHVASWARNDITHSSDPNSILYYRVDPIYKEPTTWDMAVMQEAVDRLGQITLRMTPSFSASNWPNGMDSFIKAVAWWNARLEKFLNGKNFFVVEWVN